jgi:hypothetical protein
MGGTNFQRRQVYREIFHAGVIDTSFHGADRRFARFVGIKALHRDLLRESDFVRELNSDRKETHWSKRKLKQDERAPFVFVH